MRDRERYEKRVGTVVDGRWRVERLLGLGSTSAVYAATHRNGHRAALKILHQSLCADKSMLERFLGEAGIANAIKHRAIVPIRDDGTTEDGCTYLVVELLEGDTLAALRERKKGRIEIEELAPIAEEIMSALEAVHAAGIVHRDLKPQNVFITDKGELKLLDFGTARIFDRTARSAVSAAGMVVGTPAFMSPEQARGARSEVDAQSDVWSLGAMLFTLLSGEYVHVGRDAHARLLAAASKPARKLGEVETSVDHRVSAVIDRALEFTKHERWPDVRAMRVAFREAVMASVPTMRDIAVFAAHDDAKVDEYDDSLESVAGTVSMSEPTLAAASVMESTFSVSPPPTRRAVPVEERSSQSEIPSVSSTQRVVRAKAGIPVPALVLGIGAMAAVVMLVVFFVGSDDASTRAAVAAGPGEPTKVAPNRAAARNVAPAPSFIVIEAPDVPDTGKKTESLPAWATAPVTPPKAQKEEKTEKPSAGAPSVATNATVEKEPAALSPVLAAVAAPIPAAADAGVVAVAPVAAPAAAPAPLGPGPGPGPAPAPPAEPDPP